MHRLHLSVITLLLLIVSTGFVSRVFAESLVIKVPHGMVNWNTGVITATGIGHSNVKDKAIADAERFSSAMQVAGRNLFEIVKQIRIDTDKTIEDLSEDEPATLIKVREMVYGTQEVEEDSKQGAEESLEVLLHFNLYGGFAQMVLPREIKQVESITKVMPGNETTSVGPAPEIFSGLIVDARGIDASPAMVPRIVDGKGQVVYGPAFVSREFAVQKGMAGYVTAIAEAVKSNRVGINPLTVKGLKTNGPGRSEIVISNTDAAALRKVSDHLLFLRQCRVVIVLD
jgi:ribosomal protein S13